MSDNMKKKLVISFLLMIFAIGCVSAHENNATDIASNDVVVNDVNDNIILDSNGDSNPSIDNYYNVEVYNVVDGNDSKVNIAIYDEINDVNGFVINKNLISLNAIVDDGSSFPVNLYPLTSGYLASFDLNDISSGVHTIILEFNVLYQSAGSQVVNTATFTVEKTLNIE